MLIPFWPARGSAYINDLNLSSNSGIQLSGMSFPIWAAEALL